MEYIKISASGNSFVLINNLDKQIEANPELAKRLCGKENVDGLLLIEPTKTADFRMRIFNPDGSEAEMCGNGARCVAYFAHSTGITGSKLEFKTIAGRIKAEVSSDKVKVSVGEPKDLRLYIPIEPMLHFTRVGVPHTVIFCDDVNGIDLKEMGPTIRYHKLFSQEGTNVNLVQVMNSNRIKVRTYERGVEGETLCCGTGSASSSYISHLVKDLQFPITVEPKSKEEVNVYWEEGLLYIEGSVK
ncbi:MAG: diaminopimelate epimerase [Candidatus Desantisbacteria bacterium]